MSFRYYVYISDDKVDMLLSQIDPALLRKRTTEVSVTLPLLGAKRGVEAASKADRIARLERVVRYVHDFGDVGSIEEPGQFFGGILPMRWGPFHGTSLVYFGGESDGIVVGLGGSGKHVLGASAADDTEGVPRSVTPNLLEGLAAEPEIGDLLGVGTASDDEALRAVALATANLRGPLQNVEFVAKRLLHGRVDGRHVVLGSPLYVALAD
ncbi:DUF7019 family protein [Saccharomonospora glauca]|uniref:Uncharacterized protein n=1 Tax=Saccharomonospora glauca K62 TaxID=928724 RepID=I1D4M2_9PSEU|nr:SAVMC3_10250 family protein [Saccharomonospora glauca]EIE99896.1 hypothetical protein SacglDRAFT_03028 [Saccharomonospora glauca K62]